MSLGIGLTPAQSVDGRLAPQKLGASLLAWWNADRTDLMTVTDGKISSWKDSVHLYDAVQATDAAKPLLAATFNGKNCVVFDGTDDELTLASCPFPTGANPVEIWAVFQNDAPGSDGTARILTSYGGTSNATRRSVTRDDSATKSILRGDVGDNSSAVAVQDSATEIYYRHAVRIQIGATQSKITIDNGTTTTVSVVPVTGTTRMRIGANTANTATSFWKGKVREIIYTAPQSDAQAVEMWKYCLRRRRTDLVPMVNFETILDAGAGTNTGSAADEPPTYVYTLADETVWDARAKDVAEWADSYMMQGRTNLINAQNVRDWMVDFANQRAMRLTASTVYVEGTEYDYVSARNWATSMYCWAYLKTRGSAVWSEDDRNLVKEWLSGIADDIMNYYHYTTDTLSSKQNNHLGFALLAASLAAICTNRADVLTWAVNGQKHFFNDTLKDNVRENNADVPACGYNPDVSNPLPARGIFMNDADRYQSSSGGTKHDGVFYNWYHASNEALTALQARANGINLLRYVGTNADWSGILSAYKAICDDGGAAFWAFIAANDVDNQAADVSTLRVTTHKVDADIAGLRYLTATGEFSGHAAAATINTNLASKTNQILGGSIDYIRAYLS